MAVQQERMKIRSSTRPNPKYFRSDRYLGNLLIAPAMLVILVVMIVPLGYGLLLSLTDYQLGSQGIGNLVLLENYARLFQDHEFFRSLGITLLFTVSVLFAELAIGIVMAVLLMKVPFLLGRVFRTFFTVPLLISPIIVGLAWRYMYDPLYGLIYQGLGMFNLQSNFGGLGSVNWALFCVMVADIWQTTPFILLVATSGLAAIPTDLYEAGRIDGASEFRLFFNITLPLLEKVIIVLSIIRGVDAFRVFDIIYALTGGGPANSTQSLSIYIFKQGFTNYQMGYAMAISIITMVILLAIFLPLIKRSNENTVSMY
jgi:multiple sugar transport system permease protein